MKTVKYLLAEDQMPTAWYNIQADLPAPPPPVLHPGTKQPVGPQDLAPLFPMALIMQEVSTERFIEIPEEVQAIYRQWRPTPLFRALMEAYGARVVASPSEETHAGRAILAEHPDSTGSLGIAIS
ncbi:MAG: hypothetical protein RMJ86_10825, partial [Anaerolineae bacterium]|nr:hypothetical protein [Anaerolineae bacterium]